jgi:hypothetical protein
VFAISQTEHNDVCLLKVMPLARHLKQRILPTISVDLGVHTDSQSCAGVLTARLYQPFRCFSSSTTYLALATAQTDEPFP